MASVLIFSQMQSGWRRVLAAGAYENVLGSVISSLESFEITRMRYTFRPCVVSGIMVLGKYSKCFLKSSKASSVGIAPFCLASIFHFSTSLFIFFNNKFSNASRLNKTTVKLQITFYWNFLIFKPV